LGLFLPTHRPPTHQNTSNVPSSPATPISPPSGPHMSFLNGLHPKSNFLGASLSPVRRGWRSYSRQPFHFTCKQNSSDAHARIS
jgi:hypothetical protein